MFKKILTAATAALLVLSMGVSAWAAEPEIHEVASVADWNDLIDPADYKLEVGDTIKLTADIEIDEMLPFAMLDSTKSYFVNAPEGLTLDGNGFTISASDSFLSPSAPKAADKVWLNMLNVSFADNATIKDLTIVSGANNRHGLNVYMSENLTLSNVTIDITESHAGGALILASSTCAVDGLLDITVGADAWYGINVDTSADALNVAPVLTFTENADFVFAGEKSPLYCDLIDSEKVGNAKYDPTIDAADIFVGTENVGIDIENINDDGGLSLAIDKTALNAAVAKAEALDKDLYTTATYNAVKTALDAAKALAANAGLKSVNDATAALTAALDALAVDFAALDAAIAKGEAAADDKDDYTADSYKKLTDAITAAKALKAADDVTAAKLSAAIAAINTAFDGLTSPTSVEEALAKLDSKISQAEKLDKSKYTEESYAELLKTIANAKLLKASGTATAAEAEAAQKAIEAAMSALVTLSENTPTNVSPATIVFLALITVMMGSALVMFKKRVK